MLSAGVDVNTTEGKEDTREQCNSDTKDNALLLTPPTHAHAPNAWSRQKRMEVGGGTKMT